MKPEDIDIKPVFIDISLPPLVKEVGHARVQTVGQIAAADICFLYLHRYPAMQLRFDEFEQVIADNKKKTFVFFTWFEFSNYDHYNYFFAEHFTPTQIGMWQENVHFFQLPTTIGDVLTKLRNK